MCPQYAGGHSNLICSIRVGERELALRRPPFGLKTKTAHDISRECLILKILRPVFPYCPEPLVYTDDHSSIGCVFHMVEKIQSVIFYHRETQDVRFHAMILGTIALENAARRVIRSEGL